MADVVVALRPEQDQPTGTEDVADEVPVPAHRLPVRVVWAGITEVEADVHVVGHYQGVLPSAAELALDNALSATPTGMITEHTRREWVQGKLGQITYFPSMAAEGGVVVLGALAGLGRPGTFTVSRAEGLFRSVVAELASRPRLQRVAMVLLGTGASNMTVADATQALVRGATKALASVGDKDGLTELLLVERDLRRATLLLMALREALARDSSQLELVDGVLGEGPGGEIEESSALSFVVAAAVHAVGRDGAALDQVFAGIPPAVADRLRSRVADFRNQVSSTGIETSSMPGAVAELAAAATVRVRQPRDGEVALDASPTRFSMVEDGDVIRVAAISDSATVPERTVGVDLKLIDALVDRSEAEAWKNWPRAARLLMQLVVPDDFRRVFVGDRPIVLELDRRTARLPWELLCACDSSDDVPEPLVVKVPMARQLRTTYSRVGLAAERRSGRVRALVIGDPGDPAKDHGLPGARAEALSTAKLLAERDIDVTTFVGAPGHPEPGLPWADRLDVLAELLDGDYDIVHYAGHGSFDEANPDRAGWLFADGLLTARELAQASRVPDLVFASACLSARASTGEVANPFGTSINPTLADEFLRQGVRTYIGTGSRIPDGAATTFSETFYKTLLDDRQPVGAAVRQARRVLFDRQAEFATLWASYQHYGDPRDGGPSNPG